MLYRRFTIISLLLIGVTFLGMTVLGQGYYNRSFNSSAPAHSLLHFNKAPALKVTLTSSSPSSEANVSAPNRIDTR